MSTFSIKGSFDGTEIVNGFKDVKEEIEGVNEAGKDAKKSLSEMLKDKNSTTNYKRKLSQITAELTDLSVNFSKLTQQEKNSEFGQAMAKRIDVLTQEAQELKGAIDSVSASIKGTGADLDNMAPDFGAHWSEIQRQTEQTRAKFESIQKVSAGVASGFAAVQGAAALLGKDSENLQKALLKVQSAMAIAQGIGGIKDLIEGVTQAKAAFSTLTKATKTATVAQKGLNTVVKANPYVLLATVVIAAGAALIKFAKNNKEAKEAEEEHKKALEKAAEAAQNWRDKVSSAISGPLSQYKLLEAQYKSLRTEHEKRQWINNNKTAFEDLGLAVYDLKTAEDAFVNNTNNVVQALIKRATATAKQQQLTELAGKYMDAQLRAEEEYQKKQKKAGDIVYSSSHNALSGDEYVDRNGNWVYTEQGAKKANATIKKAAYAEANKLMAEMTKLAKEIEADMPKAIKPTTSGSSSTSSSSVIDVPEVFNEKSLKYAQQKVSELQDALSKMATDSPDFAPTLAQLHEWQDVVTSIQDMMKKPEIKEPEVEIEIAAVVEEVEAAKEEIVTLEDAIQSGFDGIYQVANVISGVNSIYEAFKSLPEAIDSAENSWEKFMVAFDAGMQVINLFAGTIDMINGLLAVFNTIQAVSTSLKIKDTAASGAKASADMTAAAAAGTEAAANTAAATAGAAKSVSWLPIVGPILAVAAIAAVIGGIMAARSKGKYASGGIVDSASKIGDFNFARVNGGEMILNNRQQANLFKMLDQNRIPQNNGINGEVSFRIQGDTLVGVIDNYNRKRSRI